MNLSKPKIFEYLTPLEFLKDYFSYRKNLNADFSYEKWAEELKLGSKSLLRLIMSERRKISEPVVDLLAQQLFEIDLEREYFCDLVSLHQTRSAIEKAAVSRRLMKSLRAVTTQVDDLRESENSNEVMRPQPLRVLSVIDDARVDRTLEGLSDFFSIPEVAMNSTLENLMAKGMIQKEGALYHKELSAFKVSDSTGSAALAAFHEASLKDAVNSKDLPFDLRRFRSAIALLSREDFNYVLAEFEKIVAAVRERGLVHDGASRRLYQINFNIHSTSKETMVPKAEH
ncbi:MAG: TIGR02147 family protein [Proteobacteria bacterium]|nr:MAG: TIGR02147 family protein [Pseudomonadota bacterium]